MTSNAIEAVDLSKRFKVPTERRTSLKERLVRGRAPEPKAFWALKDATFSVPKGTSLGLIGQNGSGKSTALKVLTGIYRPTSGHVSVNGSVSALLEVGAGFHPELTGRENIRLNATILGFTNREIDRLMDSIIEFADIGDHIDAPIKHYSSGMYVRLGFAVAVMVRPEILLVDEVIAVGDEEFQRKCYDYLYDLRRAGTSMIIVSHGLGQITDLCDEAVWLESGSVRSHDQARLVTQQYLDSVNAREAAQVSVSTTPASSSTASSTYRRGSGEIRVTGVDLVDAEGNKVPFLLSGKEAGFRISYECQRSMDEVYFGFGLETADGVGATWISSYDSGPVEIVEGGGNVVFWTDQLLVAGGNYLLKTAIVLIGHVIDAIDDGYVVTVRRTGTGLEGVFIQPGAWRLPSAPRLGGTQ
jgi:ABC-2 type transport system ATP-binding protein/lipopolysaccharide transport system ATP-binding protein